ncbi:hypothetical protein like AT1G36940 [Hibiscus trionum]|uniref:Uncharacterized protein n=1 Tax=Hibiscus trionum TaxID=183268 RepID=A0A9W7IWA1_HIBTR|nr:hypothetical protein like AT1G36940 [Hibiscus trionum]
MGNGYLQHHNMHISNHKPTFLPVLCSRPAVKDVTLPKWQDPSESDPLSPKIGCMGQVKRRNRVAGCPVPHKFSITTKNNDACSNNGIKYFKLKKLFSGKNLTGSPAPTTGCRRKQGLVNRTSRSKNGHGKDVSFVINIENMDPPLPVIKRVPKQGEKGDVDTIWERRSRGVVLKSLQLQQIQLNRHQEPTTV